MTNILAWTIKTSIIHSRMFTWAVGSPWMKGLSSFSGVRVRIGLSFGSSTWGLFVQCNYFLLDTNLFYLIPILVNWFQYFLLDTNIFWIAFWIGCCLGSSTWGLFNLDANTEKSSSYSCQLELHLCFALAWRGEWWEGSCNIQRWKGSTLESKQWTLQSWLIERIALRAKKCKVDWNTVCLNLTGRLCNVISCMTRNLALRLYAVLWLELILVVHCLDADKLLFQATVVMNSVIVRSRWMLIKLANEQCFLT